MKSQYLMTVVSFFHVRVCSYPQETVELFSLIIVFIYVSVACSKEGWLPISSTEYFVHYITSAAFSAIILTMMMI